MEGPIVTCVPGYNDCTASAITCAQSCLMISRASAFSLLMITTLQSLLSGRDRSQIFSSIFIATDSLASDLEI